MAPVVILANPAPVVLKESLPAITLAKIPDAVVPVKPAQPAKPTKDAPTPSPAPTLAPPPRPSEVIRLLVLVRRLLLG